ncbi:MAG: glycosyltransferase family 39 protein, partial [Acidobacteria bacterium]|nr:glycosyltransferase family 39 protein [Acidobacteriota bacterium]
VICWTLLAFLLRLCLICCVAQVITPDGVGYVTLARSLAAGDFRAGFSTYWSPLYPLLVAGASLLFRDAEFAGRFVSVVAGALLVVPSYRLIRVWYGTRAARLAACLAALHPLLIYYSSALLTESTYTLLFTSGVLAGWSALATGRARAHLLAGATFGACYLLKPEAAGFLPLLLAAVVGQNFFTGTSRLQTTARNALLLCAGFMLLAAPYLFYLRHETGAWTLSGKLAGHLWQGSRLAGGDLAPPPPASNFTTVVVRLAKALRFEYELLNLIFPPPFVLLAGLCLFRRRWTRARARRELYLFSFVAATLAGYAVTLPNIRFLVPLLPLGFGWVARGVVEFADWAGETLTRLKGAAGFRPAVRSLSAPLAVACLLASLVPLFVYLLRGDKWDDYDGQKRAAAWIKEHDPTRAPVVMSTVPVTSFYAGGRDVRLVDEDYAALISRARREGVGYVVVNERDFRYMSLRPLLDEQSPHPGLRPVYDLADSPEHRIVVYAVEPTAPGAP